MGWSHTHMWWIKIQEGYLRSKESQPHTRLPQARFPVLGRYICINFGYKNQWGLSQWKKLLESQAVSLKKPTQGLTYSDSQPLSSSTMIAP